MSARPCARVWEAAALADGRLGADARASFERHAATCNDCSREIAGLTELSRLGQTLPVLEVTPLERRRLRQSILRRANEVALRRSFDGARIAIITAVAATVLAVFALVVQRSLPTRAPLLVATAPRFETELAPGSRYRPEVLGSHVRVRLDAGSLGVHVAKLRPEQRFLVSLPDGELEVRGTRFVVSVSGDRTQSVVVSEGRVALRIQGEAERLIAAGQHWNRANETAPPSVRAAATERSEPVVAPRERIAHGRPVALSAPTTPAAAIAASAAASSGRASAASEPSSAPSEFRAAMQAFSAGDYARADALLAAFALHYPGDARTEDAAFLRAVSHAQRGDSAGAAQLAREYLARYPTGFRRNEAERLAR